MSFVDILSLSERLGFPAIFLIFLCYAIYRVGRWFGNKLDPIFDQLSDLIASHQQLIEELKEHIKKNDEIMKKQVEITQEQLTDLTDKLTLLTELAIERNNCIKDVNGFYKYMGEMNVGNVTNLFEL